MRIDVSLVATGRGCGHCSPCAAAAAHGLQRREDDALGSTLRSQIDLVRICESGCDSAPEGKSLVVGAMAVRQRLHPGVSRVVVVSASEIDQSLITACEEWLPDLLELLILVPHTKAERSSPLALPKEAIELLARGSNELRSRTRVQMSPEALPSSVNLDLLQELTEARDLIGVPRGSSQFLDLSARSSDGECERFPYVQEVIAWQTGLNPSLPSIAVVVVSLQPSEWLDFTLRRLISVCTSVNAEVIAVVDGVPTETLRQNLAEIAKSSPIGLKVVVLRRIVSRFRAGSARNLGASLTDSPVLLFLDDDIVVPDSTVLASLSSAEPGRVVMAPRSHLDALGSVRIRDGGVARTDETYVYDGGYWAEFYSQVSAVGWMNLRFPFKFVCSYALGLCRTDFEAAGRFGRNFVGYGFEDTEIAYRLQTGGCVFELTDGEVFHLESRSRSSLTEHHQRDRSISLDATVRQFATLVGDPDVHRHFSFMMEGDS